MTLESLTESLISTGSPHWHLSWEPQCRHCQSGMAITVSPMGSEMLERFHRPSSPPYGHAGFRNPSLIPSEAGIPVQIWEHPLWYQCFSEPQGIEAALFLLVDERHMFTYLNLHSGPCSHPNVPKVIRFGSNRCAHFSNEDIKCG